MKPILYALLISVGLFFSLGTEAQQKRPSSGKAPSWVSINNYDNTTFNFQHEAQEGYVDLIFERQVSLAHRSVFLRKAIKILTEAGIQNASEISVNFDPEYEDLTFHTIKIIRGNTVINQLNLGKIKIIQQEKELNRFLYDGSLTAVLFLEDVRKDDLIEYSYTKKGANPVFKGKFSTSFVTEFAVPVANIYYKLIVPGQRKLTIKNYRTSVMPVIQERSGETIYEWTLNNVKSLHLEDNTPSWYDPFGEIMVSEYQSWKEVNDWAMELFPVVKDISPALQRQIAEINTDSLTDEQKVLKTLRFVQDNIRYMGIEMGQNSHKPHHPNKIFAQRFGDCKDKSYLFCVMMRIMGIDASPVLINSNYKEIITERLSAAKAFDHTTVQVNLNNKYYWFDPTISLQRGSIDNIAYPDYQYGLVVKEGTTALSKIDVKQSGITRIKEVFDIADMRGNAKLTVTTHYSGSFADDIRNDFSTNSRYEMQKTFKDFYGKFYKDITPDSLIYTDDDATGIFITMEYYTIKDIWELDGEVKKAFFSSYVIDGVIKKPQQTKRTMPFNLSFPARYIESVEINLPEEWNGEQSVENIQTEYFILKASHSYKQRKFLLEYEYESLRDYVMPEQTKEFMEKIKEKEDNFGYSLWKSTDNSAFAKMLETKDRKSDNRYYYPIVVIGVIAGSLILWNKRKSHS